MYSNTHHHHHRRRIKRPFAVVSWKENWFCNTLCSGRTPLMLNPTNGKWYHTHKRWINNNRWDLRLHVWFFSFFVCCTHTHKIQIYKKERAAAVVLSAARVIIKIKQMQTVTRPIQGFLFFPPFHPVTVAITFIDEGFWICCCLCSNGKLKWSKEEGGK